MLDSKHFFSNQCQEEFNYLAVGAKFATKLRISAVTPGGQSVIVGNIMNEQSAPDGNKKTLYPYNFTRIHGYGQQS